MGIETASEAWGETSPPALSIIGTHYWEHIRAYVRHDHAALRAWNIYDYDLDAYICLLDKVGTIPTD